MLGRARPRVDLRQYKGEDPGYSHSRNILTTETREPKGAFNWNWVYDWDPDSLRSAHDTETMHGILNKFVMSKFSQADMDVIKSPILFRLINVLQVVLEYMAHTTVELKRLYGQAALNETNLRNELGRAKETLRKAKRKITNVREAAKCPTCGQMFDDDIEVDKHFVKQHPELASAWKSVRENRADPAGERAARMQKQIENLRALLKKERKVEIVKIPEPKPEKPALPDYYPFKAERDARFAVHEDDNQATRTCVIQEVEHFDMAIGSRESRRNLPAHLKAKRFIEKAKSTEEAMPSRVEKLQKRVHKEGYLVAMAYNQKMVPRIVRKKIEKRTRPDEEAAPGTIHELFKNLSKPFYYDGPQQEETEEHEEEEEQPKVIEEEEEEEEEEPSEPDMEMTSLVYSSMADSADNAEYFSEGGGGTTKKQQMRPPVYIDRRKMAKNEPKKESHKEKNSDLKPIVSSSSSVPVKHAANEEPKSKKSDDSDGLFELISTSTENAGSSNFTSGSDVGGVSKAKTMPVLPSPVLAGKGSEGATKDERGQVVMIETSLSEPESDPINVNTTSWKGQSLAQTTQLVRAFTHVPQASTSMKKTAPTSVSSNSFDEPDSPISSSPSGLRHKKHSKNMHSDTIQQQIPHVSHKRSLTHGGSHGTRRKKHHGPSPLATQELQKESMKSSTSKSKTQTVALPTPKYDGFGFSEGYSVTDQEEEPKERSKKQNTGLMTDKELIAMAMEDDQPKQKGHQKKKK